MVEIDNIDLFMLKKLEQREIVRQDNESPSRGLKNGGIGQPKPREAFFFGQFATRGVVFLQVFQAIGEVAEEGILQARRQITEEVADLGKNARCGDDFLESLDQTNQAVEIFNRKFRGSFELQDTVAVVDADEKEEK
jgi:hypothetical protein